MAAKRVGGHLRWGALGRVGAADGKSKQLEACFYRGWGTGAKYNGHVGGGAVDSLGLGGWACRGQSWGTSREARWACRADWVMLTAPRKGWPARRSGPSFMGARCAT
eukprot:scaffold4613_cov129-Isochrysis_galbana.AAC.23